MSENKTLTPEEQKLQEVQESNKKSLLKAKSDTESAKAKVLDAQSAVAEAKDEAAGVIAKKALSEAQSAHSKCVDTELAARVKYAQSGSYVPAIEKEKGLYHVKLDKPAFNPKDGKKLSKAFIQMFTESEWNTFEKNSTGLGYTIEIMWNPTFFSL